MYAQRATRQRTAWRNLAAAAPLPALRRTAVIPVSWKPGLMTFRGTTPEENWLAEEGWAPAPNWVTGRTAGMDRTATPVAGAVATGRKESAVRAKFRMPSPCVYETELQRNTLSLVAWATARTSHTIGSSVVHINAGHGESDKTGTGQTENGRADSQDALQRGVSG